MHFLVQGDWIEWSTVQVGQQEEKLGQWRVRQIVHFVKSLPLASKFQCPLTHFEKLCSTHEAHSHNLAVGFKIYYHK